MRGPSAFLWVMAMALFSANGVSAGPAETPPSPDTASTTSRSPAPIPRGEIAIVGGASDAAPLGEQVLSWFRKDTDHTKLSPPRPLVEGRGREPASAIGGGAAAEATAVRGTRGASQDDELRCRISPRESRRRRLRTGARRRRCAGHRARRGGPRARASRQLRAAVVG